MKPALILSLALVAFAPGAATAQITQKFTASKASDYGLTYQLPRTAIELTAVAEFTERTPGEFHNYARRYLNITDAITEPSVEVQVSEVVINTTGVADDTNRWQVQFKAGSTPYMILDDKGALLALNTDETAEYEGNPVPTPVAASPTPLETPAARQAMTQEMIQSSSTAKRAKLAAERIFELREMRSDLISGQADNTPPDGQAMKLALDNLAAQEAALTAMFAGTVKTYTRVGSATLIPDGPDNINRRVVLRLSPTDGFVDADDLTGEPLSVSVAVTEQATLPVTDKGEPKKFPKGGVAYNIPGTATVTVYYHDRQVASEDIQLSQAGVVFGLDPTLFTDKKAPSKLQLDPATGAILLLGPAE